MNSKILFYLFIFFIAGFELSFAQTDRLFIPRNVQNAFNKGTRSLDGKPGPNYWQNRSDYKMDISFNPLAKKLNGREQVIYSNNSPDTLKEIYVHLYPNIYKRGAARDFGMNPKDEGDGVTVEQISYNGKTIDASKGSVSYIGTLMVVKLDTPILPKSKTEFTFNWNYTICSTNGIRTGSIDSTTFVIAYFFPHIAVYDDIDGWNKFQYTGQVEFYNDFSNYDVSVSVPQNYTVHASGELQNPAEVLNEKYLKRYDKALNSNEVVSIIDSSDITMNGITPDKEIITWRFKAENITDFAFGLSNHYLWDGSSLLVDKSAGRRVFIDAVYNKKSNDFYKVAKTARDEINYMSTVFPGRPFPFPKITVFNGAGGMEYPMMVNDSSEPDSDMVGLTAHEISHSYFPFYMGTNETKYAWMDEGWAAYIDYMASNSLYGIQLIKNSRVKQYKSDIGNEVDIPISVLSKHLKYPVYRYNAYIKAAYFYDMLKNILGEEKFHNFLSGYMSNWNGKHPIPQDFFNLLNSISGENFDWLINPWFYNFGYLDLGIKEVKHSGDGYKIIIAKNGAYPGQFKLELSYSDGTKEIINENASVWRNGNNSFILEKPAAKEIIKARLFDDIWLDADSSNDEYIVK